MKQIEAQDYSNYTDIQSINQLKQLDNNDPNKIAEVARQFESIMMNMALKSMREANEIFTKDSMFGSQEMDFYQDMYDKQMSLEMTKGRGMGLSDVIVKQLTQRNEKIIAHELKPDLNRTQDVTEMKSLNLEGQ